MLITGMSNIASPYAMLRSLNCLHHNNPVLARFQLVFNLIVDCCVQERRPQG
jgi:hypothetical protein